METANKADLGMDQLILLFSAKLHVSSWLNFWGKKSWESERPQPSPWLNFGFSRIFLLFPENSSTNFFIDRVCISDRSDFHRKKTRIIQFQNSVGPLGKHKDKAISWIIKAIGVFIVRFGFDNVKYQFCFPASSRSTQKSVGDVKEMKTRSESIQNLVTLWVGDH